MFSRKHFLDWLRVIAFALLILFHTGMLYVTWDYNLKSPRILPELERVLLAFSVWRMPLLFLISGAACRMLIEKLGPGAFALDRLRRLAPVILFGMFVVIPPQTWIELVSEGATNRSYPDFWWSTYLHADPAAAVPGKIMPTWDHLWFVVYLLVYALLFAGVFAATRRLRRKPEGRPLPSLLLVAPAVWLAAANVLIDWRLPLTHALVNDLGGHLKWTGMFAVGVLSATRPAFWDWLRDNVLAVGLAALGLLAVQSVSNGFVWDAVSGLYAWAAICAVCGLARRYLDRSSPLLSHLNEAVLPVYVLHQPILLAAAYLLFPLRLPLPLEASLLAAITVGAAFAIYETAIRPFAITRFLFGLKPRRRSEALSSCGT